MTAKEFADVVDVELPRFVGVLLLGICDKLKNMSGD